MEYFLLIMEEILHNILASYSYSSQTSEVELWKLFDSNQDVRQKKAIVIGLTRQLSDKYLPNLAQ